jgi:hypothetical protein
MFRFISVCSASSFLCSDVTFLGSTCSTSAQFLPCKPFPSLMERTSPCIRQKCGTPCFFHTKQDFLLPPPGYRQPKIRVRTLLSHCLYRRVIIWTIVLLLLSCLTVYSSGGLVQATTDDILDPVEFSEGEYWSRIIGIKERVKASDTLIAQEDSQGSMSRAVAEPETEPPHWMKYRQYVRDRCPYLLLY